MFGGCVAFVLMTNSPACYTTYATGPVHAASTLYHPYSCVTLHHNFFALVWIAEICLTSVLFIALYMGQMESVALSLLCWGSQETSKCFLYHQHSASGVRSCLFCKLSNRSFLTNVAFYGTPLFVVGSQKSLNPIQVLALYTLEDFTVIVTP